MIELREILLLVHESLMAIVTVFSFMIVNDTKLMAFKLYQHQVQLSSLLKNCELAYLLMLCLPTCPTR